LNFISMMKAVLPCFGSAELRADGRDLSLKMIWVADQDAERGAASTKKPVKPQRRTERSLRLRLGTRQRGGWCVDWLICNYFSILPRS
jgi:hypothetical protein